MAPRVARASTPSANVRSVLRPSFGVVTALFQEDHKCYMCPTIAWQVGGGTRACVGSLWLRGMTRPEASKAQN